MYLEIDEGRIAAQKGGALMADEKSYFELLKDPRWQRKRLEIFNRDDWTCTSCFNKDKTLHVHHKKYKWGKKPWEYDDDSLTTLCEECHEKITESKKALDAAIAKLHPGQQEMVLGFVEAFLADIDKPEVRVRDWNHGFGISCVISGSVAAKNGGLDGFEIFAAAEETGGVVRPFDILQAVLAGTWKRRT